MFKHSPWVTLRIPDLSGREAFPPRSSTLELLGWRNLSYICPWATYCSCSVAPAAIVLGCPPEGVCERSRTLMRGANRLTLLWPLGLHLLTRTQSTDLNMIHRLSVTTESEPLMLVVIVLQAYFKMFCASSSLMQALSADPPF